MYWLFTLAEKIFYIETINGQARYVDAISKKPLSLELYCIGITVSITKCLLQI